MDRSRLRAIAHADHPVAAPLSDASVARLLDRALPSDGGTILDLGCGQGAWVAAALGLRASLEAVGVDDDPAALERAEALAVAHAGRATWINHDAAAVEIAGPVDAVLCVGVAHAFGGFDEVLVAADRHVAPGGALVVGDGFWEQPPHPGTLAAGFEAADHRPLPEVVEAVVAAGWEIELAHVSSAEEWDDYEWSWTGSVVRWALEHADDPDAADALAQAREHRHHWLHGWRGTLGFVTLVLRRAAD